MLPFYDRYSETRENLTLRTSRRSSTIFCDEIYLTRNESKVFERADLSSNSRVSVIEAELQSG